jgi:O-methyltransferase involved in polyketide biosynthesis
VEEATVAGDKKITPGLQGVPETLLWTLYHRVVEARRPDAVLSDPIAVDLVDSIDYPFEERFGADVSVRAQWQALRVRRFDEEIRAFLGKCPDGMVVALGEGLETQFWRVDNGSVRWLGVDLPEVVELRRQLLPAAPRQRSVACSVLDDRWLAEVDASRGLLITARRYCATCRQYGSCAHVSGPRMLVFPAKRHQRNRARPNELPAHRP